MRSRLRRPLASPRPRRARPRRAGRRGVRAPRLPRAPAFTRSGAGLGPRLRRRGEERPLAQDRRLRPRAAAGAHCGRGGRGVRRGAPRAESPQASSPTFTRPSPRPCGFETPSSPSPNGFGPTLTATGAFALCIPLYDLWRTNDLSRREGCSRHRREPRHRRGGRALARLSRRSSRPRIAERRRPRHRRSRRRPVRRPPPRRPPVAGRRDGRALRRHRHPRGQRRGRRRTARSSTCRPTSSRR